ncbi:Ig-like domain repeat protein [Marmoricola sp. RAF53]|uniref:Ig-like domain repeat protein n=1 Tax=Marmoricola sp. RAF53 TaxID=3233059 RepID=UPI003F979F59
MPVSSVQAGELALWGDDTGGQLTLPESLTGVAISQVVLPDNARLVLTAAGRVVGWGANEFGLQTVPADVAAVKVAQIATHGGYAGAVTHDGTVLTWGDEASASPNPLDVPAGLNGVKQLALTDSAAAAVKTDGSVVAWGRPTYHEVEVPAGLRATAITATNDQFFALTEAGTVTAWGHDVAGALPAALQMPGNVKAIATSRIGGVALLADNTLVPFGSVSPPALPTEVAASDPALLANSSGTSEFAIVDRDRTIHSWSGDGAPGAAPAALNGRALTQIVLGARPGSGPSTSTGGVLITKMLRVELPQVTGSPAVGGTLTATPGTFSAGPETVTSQWLADGEAVPGQTGATLDVTPALAGKQISYRSTAAKAGEDTISSTSAAVKVPAPATIGLSIAPGRYGAAATVTASVPGAAGSVSLTLDGKPVGTQALAGGTASFQVAGTTTPGLHAVEATYAGSDTFGPGSKTGTLTVGKGRTGTPTLKVAKASPSRTGTVSVAVPTAAGLVRATGKALLVLKKGKAVKKVTLNVANGAAAGKLPRLARGRWTASVTYQGSTYYLASGPRTIRLTSK